MTVTPTARSRLEAQGFRGLDDKTLTELAPWMRWSPALCTVVMATGVALMSPTLLWAMAGIALLGAFLPFHPFDLLYNYGVRRLTHTPPLPKQGPQRRFACGLATAWLAATGWAFYVGSDTVGFALGVPLILVASLVSITHLCIPSLIYNAVVGRRNASAPGRAR